MLIVSNLLNYQIIQLVLFIYQFWIHLVKNHLNAAI